MGGVESLHHAQRRAQFSEAQRERTARAHGASRRDEVGQESSRAGLAFGLVQPAQRQGGRDAHQRVRCCRHDVGPDAARRLEEGLTRIGRGKRAGLEREVTRVRPVVVEDGPRAAGEGVVGVASGEGERSGGQDHSGNGFPYQPLDKVTCPPSGVRRGRGTHAGRAPRHRHWFRAPARADRRSAFPCLRLVRQSSEASCAGLRPARADRRSARSRACVLVRQSGEVGVPLRRALAFGPRVPTGGRRSRACVS